MKLGVNRVHRDVPWDVNGTEHAMSNAQSGQKSDDFGSRTELRQRKAKSCGTVRAGTAGGSLVVRIPNEDSAAGRARWLAELAAALDDARQLVKELGAEQGIEAVELYARIEAVRIEVQAMRLKRTYGRGEDFGPEWTGNLPWRRSA
jgi:hypothetical protein